MILFVCEKLDSSAREAQTLLEAAGARVHLEPDVYAAMAALAGETVFDRVLVDVRSIDRHELAFLTLAPRYFPEIKIEVPWLSGTSDAVVWLGQQAIKTVEVAAIAESLKSPPVAVVDVAPPPAPTAEPPRATLSTDSVETSAEPSLHEAVRMRMAGDASAPSRLPPGRKPPTGKSEPAASQNVSPEELEALFDGGIEDGNGGGVQ